MSLNKILDVDAGIKPKPCNNGCKYWAYPHLDCACMLSSAYSVNKGRPCTTYDPITEARNEKA